MTTTDPADPAALAAAALRGARALVVTAGAGMGVDSGLPDFRGPEGFWNAYPPYRRLGLTFEEAANPEHFEGDPAFGWGFYGHRAALYRATVPHQGFALLRRWIERLGLEPFVVTSNVDGQFQRAGFDPARIVEIHGSIHHLQCTGPCRGDIWENAEEVPVDEATMRAARVPACPRCGAPSRPNILMFGDFAWLPERTMAQRERFAGFLGRLGGAPLVVVELGAGTALPSIRMLTQELGARPGALAVRINPREPQIPPPHLSLRAGALDGLAAIDRALGE
ncbi:MAG TPA: Sir2 family NAD-dependent protein deacetylase [Anaeromyxobacteraceae bacterium]|nr:Sir2 family NAD-dependent protein deacetylase [Anaeromyxobacteraceae bacterium]